MALKTTSSKRVAYLVNQHPAASHTFIRREIQALESLGISVVRFALRGWDSAVVEQDDIVEKSYTRYTLQKGLLALFWPVLKTILKTPGQFYLALREALSMSRNAKRPWPYHLIYLAHACQIRRWLDGTPVDHLHAHFGTNPAEIALLVHRLGGPPFSFTIHGQDEIEGAKALHFPKKVGAAKFVVAVSAFCRSQILREIPHATWDVLKIAHCGLEEDYFLAEDCAFPEQPTFLCVGRLSPEKGHLILLDAFATLQNRNPNAHLFLAGDGPMRPAIETHVASLGLSDAVTLMGWTDAQGIKEKLSETTVLVQPSFIEGLPVVIMEALARRRPVISTFVGGIPELVRPGENGWLVPAGEPDALAEAMIEAATTDKAQLQKMGRAGHDRAKDRHLVSTEAAKIAALIYGDPS